MRIKKSKVAKIKADIAAGLTQPEIAKKHKVSRSAVSDIATGRSHKDVPWPDDEQPVKVPGGQRQKKVEYDPTDERVQELEAEVLHLRQERDHARRSAKSSQKQHGLFKAIAAEMDDRVTPFTALPSVYRFNKKTDSIEETMVLHLSDGHHDQIVTPEECGGLEEYDFNISCARAERYVDTALEWTQDTLSPKFNFRRLFILAYGDHTSGEIHGHVNRSYFRNQFKNCFAIGQLHALMYRDLAPYFDQINVVYLPGNHGRRTAKKDFHGAHDNWDYLIAEIAKLHCSQIDNIDFLVPNAFSVNIMINDVGFNLSHGDDIRGYQGIPFYGMVRRQKNLIALNSLTGNKVKYYCMGHHHVAASLADIDGELLINGAWVGTDSYAYNSFAGYREPSQWIHGVNPKYGITWRMNVHLKHEAEKAGPNRYKVELA